MRYIAAYLLASLGGNDSPGAKDIKKILESVGIEADDTRLDKVITELQGKNVNEVIASGYGKLASMPAGGAVAVASSAAPGAGGAAAPAAVEEKKEEKKEESEESDDDMGFADSKGYLLQQCLNGNLSTVSCHHQSIIITKEHLVFTLSSRPSALTH
ncbi:hypothetical protein WMY93_013439 [Mugilogobius chulae]|uniref:Large ribosomal subunit protein P2 n=1 Tax=Mugilogobius chulae TaxID=88201 RepID=A0AAW0NZZ4_9GOBI